MDGEDSDDIKTPDPHGGDPDEAMLSALYDDDDIEEGHDPSSDSDSMTTHDIPSLEHLEAVALDMEHWLLCARGPRCRL